MCVPRLRCGVHSQLPPSAAAFGCLAGACCTTASATTIIVVTSALQCKPVDKSLWTKACERGAFTLSLLHPAAQTPQLRLCSRSCAAGRVWARACASQASVACCSVLCSHVYAAACKSDTPFLHPTHSPTARLQAPVAEHARSQSQCPLLSSAKQSVAPTACPDLPCAASSPQGSRVLPTR